MRQEAVNPDMELTKSSVPNPSSPKQTGLKSGGREEINPDMDLSSPPTNDSANTGGVVNTGNREQVDPDMELSKEGPKGEVVDEVMPATMPSVGNMPTGKKAAQKTKIDWG